MIRNIVNGFCMALADSVPGVSGGTVAFIMGFYENFIDALNNIFARDKNNMKKSAIYLGKMGIGWIIGILSSILLLSALFEKNIYFMSSLFFGLSLGAIPFILRSQWENIKGKYINIGYTVFGFVLVAGLSILRNSISSGITMDFASLSVFSDSIYFYSRYACYYSNGTSGNFRLNTFAYFWSLFANYKGCSLSYDI